MSSGRLQTAGTTPGFRHIPELDGLRAVSIALVVLSHVGLQRFVPGIFGVNVFFFVSGFLITRLLLAEAELRGRIDLGRFWMRRVLRLYPALFVAVALGGAVYVAVGGRLEAGDVAASLLYAANYWEIYGGYQSGVAGVAHPYGILWSLAIEEHFYIVAPLLAAPFLGVARRGGLTVAVGVAILAVTAWRIRLALACGDGACHAMRVLHGTDTRIDSILYGVGLTTWLASPGAPGLRRVLAHPAAAPCGLLLIAASLLVRDGVFRETLRFGVQGCGLFLSVGALLFGRAPDWVRRVLGSAPARVLGRWSYSLYLWHWITLIAAVQLLPPGLRDAVWSGGLPWRTWLWFAGPVVLVSLAAAAVSYHFVERPMLALRHRFGSHA